MAFMMFRALPFLVAVSLFYYISDIAAAKTYEICERELATANLALINSVRNNNNRDAFKTECQMYRTLILECQVNMTLAEVKSINEAYSMACDSEQVKSWLASGGIAARSSVLFGSTLLFVPLLLQL